MDALQMNQVVSHDMAWSYDGQYDNGVCLVHPMRLDPMPHNTATGLHSIGLAYHHQAHPPALLHDMSHLTSGMLINPRALEAASNLTDPTLVLKRFHPGTHADPEYEKPLSEKL